MKDVVVGLVSKEVGWDKKKVERLVAEPPSAEFGDYAFPCFVLAKSFGAARGIPSRKETKVSSLSGKNPLEVASDLADRLRKKLPKEVSSVDFKGGYVNFFLDKKILVRKVLKKVEGKGFGKIDVGKGKKIVIDMSSPNIAKPFGIGHLRSTIIGNSIGKICEANGFKVVKINYLGDWGTGFGRVIFGFKKWGSEAKLKKNPVGHLYKLYVRAGGEEFEEGAREEFRKLEEGDSENVRLWKKFKKFSLKEFDSIYDLLGVWFDVVDGESNYNDKMESVIGALKKKKLLKKDDGADVVDLSKDGLGVALIRKSDGASLYTTRDLALAIERKKKYKFDRAIYEVGSEQKLHFRQVFKVLEKMGYLWSKNLVHVSHGLYMGSDGKKLASRSGKTVLMKDILDEVMEKARGNLEGKRLSKKILDERSRKIALAAIFYGDLKNYREGNMVFDIDRFLSFEGDTGPYLLYSYARASSIVRKIRSRKAVKIVDLKDVEIKLIKKIGGFEDVVRRAYDNLAPNLIANYSFELAQMFNEFYHSCPVKGSLEEGFRLKLVDAFRVTLEKSLELLGIGVLEEM